MHFYLSDRNYKHLLKLNSYYRILFVYQIQKKTHMDNDESSIIKINYILSIKNENHI